jgi:hypothetical protein
VRGDRREGAVNSSNATQLGLEKVNKEPETYKALVEYRKNRMKREKRKRKKNYHRRSHHSLRFLFSLPFPIDKKM